MASTQVGRKYVQQQQKYSLAEKKELGELDENVSAVYSDPSPSLLNLFSCILHLPLFIWDQGVVASTEDQ